MKTASAGRTVWLDSLRSFITLLVVAHHAALAYPTFAYFDSTRYIYSTAPVVDTSRWVGIDLFIGFNDLFFMPLMFLISGLFVNQSLTKKGIKGYLTDRLLRLGVPFLIAELVLIPIAYLPSFYLVNHSVDLSTFARDYLIHQQWPVGPPWFIWLLLVFDGTATLIFNQMPSFFVRVGRGLNTLSNHPLRLGVVLYTVVGVCLIPLSLWVGQYTWVGNWGPFDFQLNRLLFYFLFYVIGSCLGATDWQTHFFHRGRWLGLSWPVWVVSSLTIYGVFVAVSGLVKAWIDQARLPSTQGYLFYDLAFVASCLGSVSACLSFFHQKVSPPHPLWSSLSANAYGIYVVHYGFVTWLQFALLPTALPVVIKVGIVFLGALSLSWGTSILARRSKWIVRIL